MEFSIKSSSPDKQRSACVIVGVYESRKLTPAASALDAQSQGYLSDLLKRGDMEGRLGTTLPAAQGAGHPGRARAAGGAGARARAE